MLCGLPCSGKTSWVKKRLQEFPEKMYYVIGIDSVLSKMKVSYVN
jgi:tRNA uridine 5-carbamoylmethylation protein Kti12